MSFFVLFILPPPNQKLSTFSAQINWTDIKSSKKCCFFVFNFLFLRLMKKIGTIKIVCVFDVNLFLTNHTLTITAYSSLHKNPLKNKMYMPHLNNLLHIKTTIHPQIIQSTQYLQAISFIRRIVKCSHSNHSRLTS